MWALIARAGMWLLGLLFGTEDARDREREAGEKLGQKETEANDAEHDLKELEDAVQARDAADAADRADPGRLRDGGDAARPYRPGPD